MGSQQAEFNYTVLHLVIVLIGFALIIGGPKAVKVLLRFLVTPFIEIAAKIWFLVVLILVMGFVGWEALVKIFPEITPFLIQGKPTTTEVSTEKTQKVSHFDYPVGDLEPNGRRNGAGWWVAQDFADKKNPARADLEGKHLGEDWNKGKGSEDAGEWVYSIGDGVVITAEKNDSYGHYVMIQHPLSTNDKEKYVVSLYGHLSTKDLIAKGANVKRGTPIGRVGEAGDNGFYHPRNEDGTYQIDSSGNPVKIPWLVHLHFEIREPTTRFKFNEIGVFYSDDKTGFLNPTNATSDGNKSGGGWVDSHR